VRAERIFTVRREAMVHTMDCVDSEHGGAVSLLRAAGLDDARVERLSSLLLSSVWP
jgi:hypothetical protein